MFKVLIALAAIAACASAASTTGAPTTNLGSGSFNAISLGSAALCLSDGEAAAVLIGTGFVGQDDIVDVVEDAGELVVVFDASRVDPDTVSQIVTSINSANVDGACAGTLAASAASVDTSDYDSGALAKINFCTTGRHRRGKSSKDSSKKGGKGEEEEDCVEIVQPRASKKAKKNKKMKKGNKDSGKKMKSKKSKKSNKGTMYGRTKTWSNATAAQKSVYILGSMATVAVGLALVVAGIRRKNKRAGYREIENAEEKPKQAATSEDAKESSPFLTKI